MNNPAAEEVGHEHAAITIDRDSLWKDKINASPPKCVEDSSRRIVRTYFVYNAEVNKGVGDGNTATLTSTVADRLRPRCVLAVPPVAFDSTHSGIHHKDVAITDSEIQRAFQSIASKLCQYTETIVQNLDRKSTRLNSSHIQKSRMPSSA